MSQYDNLKATIALNVYQNHNNKVTANMVKAAMDAMTDSLGAGYQYLGIATPTSPGTAQTPDQKVFYIATTPGTYTYLGGLVVNDGEVAVLKWDTAWHKEVTGAATAAQVTELGQNLGQFQMPVVSGLYYMAEVGSTMSFDILQNSNYVCAKIPCTPGDIFFASGRNKYDVKTPYLYTDANGVVLMRHYGDDVANGYSEAPEGAAFFVFVSMKTYAMLYCYKKDSAIAIAIRSTFEQGYYECITSANVASKAISLSGWQTPPAFNSGSNIRVKFSNANSVSSNVTLLGRPLYYNDAPVTNLNTWAPGDVLELYTDGTIWYAKDATSAKLIELGQNVDIIQSNNFRILAPTPDNGIRVLGDVGQQISTSISEQANHSSIILDCVPGDVFLVKYSISAPIYSWAILDANDTVLRRGKKSPNYVRRQGSSIILVPFGGAKAIFNYETSSPFTLSKADAGTVESISAQARENYGYYKISSKRDTNLSSTGYIFGGLGEIGAYVNNEHVVIFPKRVTANVTLRAQFIKNGQFSDTSWGATLTDNTPVIIESSDTFGTLIGISITFSPTALLEQYIDAEIFTNASYDLRYLPSGSLPEGGQDGDVLRTDGLDPYWGGIPTQVVTDESQVLGVLVDQYEDLNVGVSSVNSIRRAIEVAGVGGTIVFSPNKTYNIDSTITMMKDQVIIGNGATLRRMNESSSQIAAASQGSTIQVSSVPSNWAVGDRLIVYTGSTKDDVEGYADITGINGNTISLDKSISVTQEATVTKSVCMISSAQRPIPHPVKIFNLTFDGNAEHNSSSLWWFIHGTISVFGYGTIIDGCKFINIPTENISTQGAVIRNCYGENLNGSFVHLSCPATQMLDVERYQGTVIIGNVVNHASMIDNAITGHSAAVIEQSWNPGRLTIIGNQFYGSGKNLCYNIATQVKEDSPSSTENNGLVIIVGNVFTNFAKISNKPYANWVGQQREKLMCDNIFKDCGTTDFTELYGTDFFVENNLLCGNTVVNTNGNTRLYRIDTEIATMPSAADLTAKYGNLPFGGVVYITQLTKQFRKVLLNSTVTWLEEEIQVLN